MIKAVGLEMRWPPEILGGLFIKGKNFKSIEYWYKAITEKQ